MEAQYTLLVITFYNLDVATGNLVLLKQAPSFLDDLKIRKLKQTWSSLEVASMQPQMLADTGFRW